MSVHHNIHNSIACYPLGTFDILSFGAQVPRVYQNLRGHVSASTFLTMADAKPTTMLPIAAAAVNIIANPLRSC